MMKALIAALGIAGMSAQASAAPAAAMLDRTIAEMTQPKFEAAAANGAIVLWALGAIEQHGPHLPLATDVYIPQSQLNGIAERLRRQDVQALILPPYYWGVNSVTGAFAGSIHVRPEVMAALMSDVFASLKAARVREVFCITGHWDAAHVRTIAEAVAKADGAGLRVRFLAPDLLADRLKLEGPTIVRVSYPSRRTAFPDIHAGEDETSAMLAVRPGTVRSDVARDLPPTRLSSEDLAKWRTGGTATRQVTPQGYVGAPADARAATGQSRERAIVEAFANAIAASRR